MLRLRTYLLILLALVGATCTSLCRAADPVIIAIPQDILPDYHTFVHGRELMSISNYSGPGARRDVIELVLLQQALQLGNYATPIELHSEQSYLRIMRAIAEGHFITSAGLAWKADIDATPGAFYSSRAVIKEGEFAVGIYTTPHNRKALAARSQADISQLSAVTSSQWKNDVHTLYSLGISHIIYSPNWVNMARMIDADRVDITLAPFQQTRNMTLVVDDIILVPITGIKVVLNGSRHWPISRKHPQGQAFYEALERGLAQLESRGVIQKAYRECGFFHPEIADWLQLKVTPLADPSQARHPLDN